MGSSCDVQMFPRQQKKSSPMLSGGVSRHDAANNSIVFSHLKHDPCLCSMAMLNLTGGGISRRPRHLAGSMTNARVFRLNGHPSHTKSVSASVLKGIRFDCIGVWVTQTDVATRNYK